MQTGRNDRKVEKSVSMHSHAFGRSYKSQIVTDTKSHHKHAWVKYLEDKGKRLVNSFIKIVNGSESNRKPKQLWVNQGREFYSSPMQIWLGDHDIFLYSRHYEGKSIRAERFVKTLKG